jgi:NAD(P)-dependent dehydrogenase (short-subunit alcohol dehydrogenase family)
LTGNWHALVLAAGRGENDPMAKAHHVSHKATLPVGGIAMLDRVLDTLRASRSIGAVTICIEDREIVQERLTDAGKPVRFCQSASSAPASVLAAIRENPHYPLLVTTADHPLLTPAMVDYFCTMAEANEADLSVGLATAETILQAYPQSLRTFFKLGRDRVSGCNLFALTQERASLLVERWQELDRQRKKPWKLVAAFGPIAHTDPAAWRRCIDVNVHGTFNTVHAALPEIVRRRGFVAVSASVATFAHAPAMSAYAASKAAAEAMCNSWRIELAAHGVGVGVIHSSWVSTPLVSEGALHPAFARLRATMPGPLNREMAPDVAARHIADGLARRDPRIWIPGWVRMLHWLRAMLHSPLAERELLRAAPEIEQLYLDGLMAEGALASSLGPRERAREADRRLRRQTDTVQPTMRAVT